MKNIEDRCEYYTISRNRERNNKEFKKIGCYDCDGFNRECDYYISTKELKNILQIKNDI